MFAVICIKMVVVPSVCVVAQVLCMVIHNLHAQLCRAQQFLNTHEHGTGTPASGGKVRSPVHTSLEIRQSTPNGLYHVVIVPGSEHLHIRMCKCGIPKWATWHPRGIEQSAALRLLALPFARLSHMPMPPTIKGPPHYGTDDVRSPLTPALPLRSPCHCSPPPPPTLPHFPRHISVQILCSAPVHCPRGEPATPTKPSGCTAENTLNR